MSTKLRVYLEPTGLCEGARSMQRIKRALTKYAPPAYVEVVDDRRLADLFVLYVIGRDAISVGQQIRTGGQRYAAIQCCFGPNHPEMGSDAKRRDWFSFWNGAEAVWSYYNLSSIVPYRPFPYCQFLHAPLGLDPAFAGAYYDMTEYERNAVLTTGYVNGPGAEAIEDVWKAAHHTGLKIFHVGPKNVVGIVDNGRFLDLTTHEGITDELLVDLMSQCKWVASLRYVEGFELPAAEGLACFARPLLFDQPDLRHWYGDHAYYVDETKPLFDQLACTFSLGPAPVTKAERDWAISTFNWKTICETFWTMVLSS